MVDGRSLQPQEFARKAGSPLRTFILAAFAFFIMCFVNVIYKIAFSKSEDSNWPNYVDQVVLLGFILWAFFLLRK